jgi:hypothetical protein
LVVPKKPAEPKVIRIVGDSESDQGQGAAGGSATATGQTGGSGTFFVYKDSKGVQHIVDSVKLVPKQYRKGAKRWRTGDEKPAERTGQGSAEEITSVEAQPPSVAEVSAPVCPTLPPVEADGRTVHVPSLLLGIGLGAVFFLVWLFLRRRSSALLKLLIGVFIATLLSAGYVGWVRRQAGFTGGIPGPTAAIEDARRAADALQQRSLERTRLLEDIVNDQPKEVMTPP